MQGLLCVSFFAALAAWAVGRLRGRGRAGLTDVGSLPQAGRQSAVLGLQCWRSLAGVSVVCAQRPAAVPASPAASAGEWLLSSPLLARLTRCLSRRPQEVEDSMQLQSQEKRVLARKRLLQLRGLFSPDLPMDYPDGPSSSSQQALATTLTATLSAAQEADCWDAIRELFGILGDLVSRSRSLSLTVFTTNPKTHSILRPL